MEVHPGLSPDSTKKVLSSKDILRRQERVVDVLNVIDELKLDELGSVKLAEEAKSLPHKAIEKELMEKRIEEVTSLAPRNSPSVSGIGGAVGALLGGLIGTLVARSAKNGNYVGWSALGAALGGSLGALIGSFWD